MQTKSRQTLGNVIFLVGVFLGLGLAIAAIWGDFEGISYFSNGAGYEAFGGLSCPILMSRSDVATISARLDNPGDTEIQPYYQVEISGAAAARELEGQVPVTGHSSRTVKWTVDAKDIDLGYFIFVKMNILPVAGHSTREGTCGIVVLNVRGPSGEEIFGGILGASLLGMVFGLGLRESGNENVSGGALNQRNGLRAVAILTSAGMLTGFMGSWLIGFVLCAMAMLLMIVLLRFIGT
ncbi:MAG: hypothetical protein ACXWNQ_02040 [Anaerolineales bacterium]